EGFVERDGLELDADRTLRRDASANVRAARSFESPNALGDGKLGRVDREPVVAVLHGGQRRRRDRRRQDEGHERSPSEPGHVERRYSMDSVSASQSAARRIGKTGDRRTVGSAPPESLAVCQAGKAWIRRAAMAAQR